MVHTAYIINFLVSYLPGDDFVSSGNALH